MEAWENFVYRAVKEFSGTFRFWQIASTALGTLVLVIGLATWALGRWASTRGAEDSTRPAQEG